MVKLVKVDNPGGTLRVEGPLIHFDEVVPLQTAVYVIAHAYKAALGAKGIDAEVYTASTTDTPGFRSHGIYASGVKLRGRPRDAILFEVVSGKNDGQVYTFSRHADPSNLEPDKRALLEVEREKMFDAYINRELSDILSQ